eukprot:EG_transcript_21549
MLKAARALLGLPLYRRLTHSITPEHHYFPDRITPADVQLLMRQGTAPQCMRAMLNYRNWIVPIDPEGRLFPINDTLRGHGPSLFLFSEPSSFDAWRMWMAMRNAADPKNEAFQLPEGLSSTPMSGLDFLRAMVHEEADKDCQAVLVDLQRWLARATFRSAFAWHNNLLVEAALTSLSMGAQPHVMPPTGQYLSLNLASEDGYLVVYTDAPSLIEYQEEVSRDGSPPLPLLSLTGKGLIRHIAEEGLRGALFNPGTPLELLLDGDQLPSIPGHADDTVDDSLSTAAA